MQFSQKTWVRIFVLYFFLSSWYINNSSLRNPQRLYFENVQKDGKNKNDKNDEKLSKKTKLQYLKKKLYWSETFKIDTFHLVLVITTGKKLKKTKIKFFWKTVPVATLMKLSRISRILCIPGSTILSDPAKAAASQARKLYPSQHRSTRRTAVPFLMPFQKSVMPDKEL